MKAILLSTFLYFTINLLCGEAGAQNVWFVDINATGGNDTGRDWANAWTDFDSVNHLGTGRGINWSIIEPGDTIYVSGGATPSDTTFYSSASDYGFQALWQQHNANYTFASGDPVVITRAWHPGHNGFVVFTEPSSGTQYRTAWFGLGLSNIVISGFTFWNRREFWPAGSVLALGAWEENSVYGDSLIVLENCHLITEGGGMILGVQATNSIIRNCILEHRVDNDYDGDTDPLGIVGGNGGLTIDNNVIILRNGSMNTTSHKDMIQWGDLSTSTDPTDRRPFIISNNLIIDTREEGTNLNAVFYTASSYGNYSLYIYNNILVSRKIYDNLPPFFIYQIHTAEFWDWHQSVHILNNTVITKGEGSTVIFTHTWLDTVEIKNNLIVIDTTYNMFYNMDGADGFPFSHKEIDYNLFAARGGIHDEFGIDNSVVRDLTGWRSVFGYDINSDTMDSRDVTFVNKYGETREDYYTETGNGQGVNLWDEYPFLRTDALGNPRPETGSWDIGALQYTGSQSNNVRVRGKVYLQGPFNNNLMATNLNQGSYLPNSQPYNQPPWNYNGNESFSSGPNSVMVDWVLVELRNAANPTQVISRRAAILKNDGLLLEPNGSEGVFFTNVDPGSYYIAIHHRNHLAIMSAAPVELSLTSVLYDFTNAMNKAYGQNPMVELGTGKYGMFATDGNADGVVNTSDRDNVWLIQNGNMGYLEGDFNMNSGVTIHDVNQLWNINNGKTTQVP